MLNLQSAITAILGVIIGAIFGFFAGQYTHGKADDAERAKQNAQAVASVKIEDARRVSVADVAKVEQVRIQTVFKTIQKDVIHEVQIASAVYNTECINDAGLLAANAAHSGVEAATLRP